MALMKCQIKNIKSSEKFETYKEFIDNEIKLLYDIRFKIRLPIVFKYEIFIHLTKFNFFKSLTFTYLLKFLT
jgi:hypothetical protein